MNCPKCNEVMVFEHFWKGGVYKHNNQNKYDFELWDFCPFCNLSGKKRAFGTLSDNNKETINWISEEK